MKYLAILKDSLREAVDTKVLYFTVALSILLVLVVGSISYRSVPAEEQFKRFTALFTWIVEMGTQGQGFRYDIEDFQQTNEAAEPWKGDYRCFLVVDFKNEKDAEEVRKSKVLSAKEVQNQLRDPFRWVDQLTVTEVESTRPTEIRFRVETRGTKVTDRADWTHEPGLFFGAVPVPWLQMPLSVAVEFITDKLIGTTGAGVTMLLSIIITAFFIPNMLRKGTVDLLLSKPIHRTTLLVYKFIGGLTFMFLNTVVIMGGLWVTLGLQTGMWVNGLLLCILIFTFQFAIFYAVSALMAVLTQSPIVSILVSVLVWAVLFGVGWGYRIIDGLRPERQDRTAEIQPPTLPGWVFTTADVVHFVLPRYKDLDVLATRVIRSGLRSPANAEVKASDAKGSTINWPVSIGITTGYIVLLVGLACWRFARRDY